MRLKEPLTTMRPDMGKCVIAELKTPVFLRGSFFSMNSEKQIISKSKRQLSKKQLKELGLRNGCCSVSFACGSTQVKKTAFSRQCDQIRDRAIFKIVFVLRRAPVHWLPTEASDFHQR